MAVSPEDLKQIEAMMTAAKREPIDMVICYGTKADGSDAVVKISKTKGLANLVQTAKKEGATNKIGIGTLSVEGPAGTFKCLEKPPSGLAKQLKGFFKINKLGLKMKVVGLDGAEIPEEETGAKGQTEGQGQAAIQSETSEPTGSDSGPQARWDAAWAEVVPKIDAALRAGKVDVGKLRAVRDFAQGKAMTLDFEAAHKSLATLLKLIGEAPATGTDTGAGTTKSEEKAGADPKAVAARIVALKPRLAEIQGPLADKLNEIFQQAVAILKAAGPGAADAAQAELGKIDAALARLDSAKTLTGEGKKDAGDKGDGTAADPKFAKIGAAEAQLRKQVDGLPAGDARDGLTAVLESVLAAVQKGEAESALSGMKKVQDGLKLVAEVDRLAPLVAQAASSGMVDDVNRLTLLFNTIADRIPAPDHAKAMTGLARIEQMIADGAKREKSTIAEDAEMAPDVKPFVVSRINWAKTREGLRSEIQRLRDAIADKLSADPDLVGATDSLNQLFSPLERLDQKLEAKLAEIVNAESPEEREAMKAQARTILTSYRSELNTPFFKSIDANNGFISLSVASSAGAALDELSRVLTPA